MSEQYPRREQLDMGMTIRLGLQIPNFSYGTRFEKLEEALQIIAPMLHGERPSFAGK
jgi:hypothetical protein